MSYHDRNVEAYRQRLQTTEYLVLCIFCRTGSFDVVEAINEDSFDAILTYVFLCSGAERILVKFIVADVKLGLVNTGQLRVDSFLCLAI